MGAFGIMKKIRMNSVPDRVIPKQRDELKPLTMEPFVLAFLILPLGYTISTAVLVLERIKIRTQLN